MDIPDGLVEELNKYVFSLWDQEWLKTPDGYKGKMDVVINRLNDALRYSIPWMNKKIDLKNSRVVEIGCGSGSSTVALAMNCKEVFAFDIDEMAIKACEARCKSYGLQNVHIELVKPEDLLIHVIEVGSVDVYVLYAVLEHQTIEERLNTLSMLWSLLDPGKFLVIIETPNRLVYLDRHTTGLDFFHLLPDALAFRYMDRVQRNSFVSSIEDSSTLQEASLTRVRWGLGASYHEFEVSLQDDLRDIIVADGTEQEMVDWFPIGIEEITLTNYFQERLPDKPKGFSKAVLNLIFRKPE